jgi:hypothetical protein
VASDDATVPRRLRLLLAARGVPQTDLRYADIYRSLLLLDRTVPRSRLTLVRTSGL